VAEAAREKGAVIVPYKNKDDDRACRLRHRDKNNAKKRTQTALKKDEINAARRERYASDPQYAQEQRDAAHTYRKANIELCRERDRLRYSPERLEQKKANSRKLRRENPEQYRQRDAEYRVTHRHSVVKRQQRWYESHKDEVIAGARKWCAANSERRKEVSRDWARRNPHTTRAACLLRRARIKGATVGDTREIIQFLKEIRTATRVLCHWCKKPIPKGKREADHVIPLARGGAHSRENLVPCCRSCNCRKSDSLPHEFTGQHELPFGSAT
jgi:5-methylcytosine-specific restriction endonuclease McrA